MRPIFELRLGQNGFEQLERRIFERITLHVDIDKCPEFARAAKKRPKLGANMGNRIRGRIGSYWRIRGRYLDQYIYTGEGSQFFAEWVGPISCFARQFLE